jgi:DNA-binding NtrC family response regulator
MSGAAAAIRAIQSDHGFRIDIDTVSRLPSRRLAALLMGLALRNRDLLDALRRELASTPGTPEEEVMVGESPAMMEIFDRIRRFAPTEAPVLITGESGTGKELAARALHERSGRAGGPFIALNCASLPPSLIASELFGHEKGAFTGAATRRIGHIESANGGTLFLDEIGDLPIETQGHLLRFLQDRRIVRLGATEPIPVDVRIISATHVPLEAAIRDRRFREDLYYRLYVLTLHMPPLRERGADVELLAQYVLRRVAGELGRDTAGFSPDALAALKVHAWPGNVRELIATIRRAVVMGSGPLVGAAELGLRQAAAPPSLVPSPHRQSHDAEGQRAALLAAIEEHAGNVAAAARHLGVSRVTLYRMMRRHGVALRRDPTLLRGDGEACRHAT